MCGVWYGSFTTYHLSYVGDVFGLFRAETSEGTAAASAALSCFPRTIPSSCKSLTLLEESYLEQPRCPQSRTPCRTAELTPSARPRTRRPSIVLCGGGRKVVAGRRHQLNEVFFLETHPVPTKKRAAVSWNHSRGGTVVQGMNIQCGTTGPTKDTIPRSCRLNGSRPAT